MSLSMLIFDCQGVIVEAIDAKVTALQTLAHPYGTQACEHVSLFHQLYPQASCKEIFTGLMERDASLKLSLEKIHSICQQFQRAYQDAEYTAPLLAHILAILQTWHTRLPIHVCSSMPQDALRNMLTQRKLKSYFTGIHGTPPSKHQQVQKLVNASCFDPADIVMIGDTIADFDIALSVGTRFYGCNPHSSECEQTADKDMAQNQGTHPIWARDLSQLSTWLEQCAENP